MATVSILLAIVVAISGGLSFVASSALPGDALYPIKIGVKEQAQGALHLSTESRADFAADLLNRRLDEASTLAADGQLKGEVRADVAKHLTDHMTRTRRAIAALQAAGEHNAAADITARAAADIAAHEQSLRALMEAKSEVRADAQELLRDVVNVRREAEQMRVDVESQTSVDVDVDADSDTDTDTSASSAATSAMEEDDDDEEEEDDSTDSNVSAGAEAEGSIDLNIGL